MKVRTLAVLVCLVMTLPALAANRAVNTRPAIIYIQPDTSSAKLVTMDRGRELTILERTPNGWAHITATVQEGRMGDDRDITGWTLDKGLIGPGIANGDQIIYGEAVESENEASRRFGRKGAEADARRLYYRLYESFPASPLAGESLYRAADIQWQLEKADQESRASSRKRDPNDRMPIEEEMMKTVIKKFPNTKWADLAAFHLLDNKLCGEWQMQSKCPEREAALYEKYADEHANSPAAPEALYNAAYRWAALVQIFPLDGQKNKVADAQRRATALAQRLLSKNASADWNARAQRLIYMVEKNIPTFGNTVE